MNIIFTGYIGARFISGMYNSDTEEILFMDGEEAYEDIKCAYSQAIVEEETEKMPGWTLKEVSPSKYLATKLYSNDKIEIEVLQNGMIKTTVPGKISPANHASAEQFLLNIARAGGGTVTRSRLSAATAELNRIMSRQ